MKTGKKLIISTVGEKKTFNKGVNIPSASGGKVAVTFIKNMQVKDKALGFLKKKYSSPKICCQIFLK